MAKAKKCAISGEYVITVETEGSIKVSRIYDNVLGSLREIAEAKGIEFDHDWTTRQFGKKIVDNLGDGESAEVGDLTVARDADGAIWVLRVCDNAKGALREVAQGVGFDYDPAWNTRQLGNKLVGFINKADTGADALDEALDKAGKALEDFTEKLGAEISDKAGKAVENIADKLGIEVAEAADKVRDAADNGAYANFDGYFRGDDETIPLAGGRRVLVVSMWTKTSLANIVAKAAEHGIVVAEEADKAGADFSGKGFSLEYLGGVLLAGHVRRQRQGG